MNENEWKHKEMTNLLIFFSLTTKVWLCSNPNMKKRRTLCYFTFLHAIWIWNQNWRILIFKIWLYYARSGPSRPGSISKSSCEAIFGFPTSILVQNRCATIGNIIMTNSWNLLAFRIILKHIRLSSFQEQSRTKTDTQTFVWRQIGKIQRKF